VTKIIILHRHKVPDRWANTVHTVDRWHIKRSPIRRQRVMDILLACIKSRRPKLKATNAHLLPIIE